MGVVFNIQKVASDEITNCLYIFLVYLGYTWLFRAVNKPIFKEVCVVIKAQKKNKKKQKKCFGNYLDRTVLL